ncbi:acid-sensing ion channel 1-like isoform X1 [Brachionus plicatilis]|uniref:Acid-sensing ion channel 1-like isoform X1 n=1 Tax=Brachionus plicatilis TaxID=10195 RepID=A0A3M7RPG9_BRAPC|nr:acid-sensing ion channel 1-like isoform X1 [Brachionus plicatilis]
MSKEHSYTQKLREIVESSTIHGIPNVLRSKNKFLRYFWTVAFLVFFSYCMYSVVLIIFTYLQFNVIVRMQIVQTYNAEFPAVTFCNINPYDFTIGENLKNVTKLLNESFLYAENFNSKRCDTQMNNVLNVELPNLHGFSLDKLLISCQYDGKPCDPNNFFPQRAFYFGNCYTFNYGKNSTGHQVPIEKSKRPGTINGLKLKLFVGAPEYQPCWEYRFGALIVVHNRTSPPLYAEEGLFIQTGAETNFILNKVRINKMPSPYSDCVVNVSNRNEFNSVSYRNAFDFSGSYRQKWCVLNCSVARAIEENMPKCSALNFATNLERTRCINDLENLTKHYDLCSGECPIECDYSFFNVFKSTSSFPSYAYAKHLLANPTFRSKFPYENITFGQVRDSVVALNVYFDSNNYQRIEELPESNFGSLLGNLGGQLGLFLGVSFLTFAELVEIFVQMAIIYFRNLNKSSSRVEILKKNQTAEKVLEKF